MRKTVLSCLVLLICLAASLEAGVNHWTPIGPFGGQMQTVVADPQKGGVVYAGTWGGVFKSTDSGATWRRTSKGLRDSIVYALAVAPSNSNVVYVSTSLGVFVSPDAGETWQGPKSNKDGVLALAVDPRDSRRVWAGTSNNVAWSGDSGNTWSYFETTDQGTILRVPEIVIDPVHPDTVYALSRPLEDQDFLKIVKTTDGGATWTQHKGLDNESYSYDSLRLAVDPTAPNVVYASLGLSTEDGITYRSTDGGATWSPTPGTYPVAVDSTGVVYAGRMRSADHGETWTETAAPPRSVDYATSAAGNGTIWAATEYSGIYRSVDGGATWQASSQGLHATGVGAVAVDPELPRVIYAATYESGLRKTLSSGLRWRAADSGLPITARMFNFDHLLAIDPRQPQTLYLVWGHGFARSDDGGGHWTVLHEHFGDAMKLVVNPDTGAVYVSGAYLIDGHCRLARSDDRGATFRCLPGFSGREDGVYVPHLRLFVDPANPSNLWVPESRNRLWKSTDGGNHWTLVRPRGLEHAGEPRALAVDPINPGRLYMGTNLYFSDDRPERVWRSDDSGRTWRPWGRGVPEASWITDLLVDPERHSIVYISLADQIGSGSGVYQSRNAGRTFKPMRDGLPGPVAHLIFDPSDSRRLYAGTPYNGVYTFTFQRR